MYPAPPKICSVSSAVACRISEPNTLMIDASMECSSMASICCFCASGAGIDRGAAGIQQARRPIGHGLGGVGVGGDVAQLLANEVEFGDRLAELLAVARVAHAQLQAVFRGADGANAQFPATDVEDVERDLVTLPDLPQHSVRGDLAVLQDQGARRAAPNSQLVLLGTDRQTLGRALDQEPGELLAVDLGEHGEKIGEAGVGDVLLGAGQLPGLSVGRQIALVLAASASDPEPGSVSA